MFPGAFLSSRASIFVQVSDSGIVRLHMKILSVDGGGYLGLATASLLEEAERHFQSRANEVFDLFCGTSSGAIIALALASGLSAKQVRELYLKFGPESFCNPIPGVRWFRTWISSRSRP